MKTILKFDELQEKILVNSDNLSICIRGHLMIEFICLKILQETDINYYKQTNNLSHYKIIKAIHELEFIDDNQKEVLLEINKLRNRFAHDINFIPSVEEISKLIQKAKRVFYEYFDGFSRSRERLNEVEVIDMYEIQIFIDFFMEVIYNLASNCEDLF